MTKQTTIVVIGSLRVKVFNYYKDCFKRTSAFDYLQNVQICIILHMQKVSSRLLLFIDTMYSIQWFC